MLDLAPAAVPIQRQQVADEHPPKLRGYFNQGQPDDLETAGTVRSASHEHVADLPGCAITAKYPTGVFVAIGPARDKVSAISKSTDTGEAATLSAVGAVEAPVMALQSIQSAAKQKRRISDQNTGASTKFSTKGYSVNQCISGNHFAIVHNAAPAPVKATSDLLSGYDAAGLVAITTRLEAHEQACTSRQSEEDDRSRDKDKRDLLSKKINSAACRSNMPPMSLGPTPPRSPVSPTKPSVSGKAEQTRASKRERASSNRINMTNWCRLSSLRAIPTSLTRSSDLPPAVSWP